MYLFGEDDVDSFRSCVAEHIQAVVDRYRGKVHLWICRTAERRKRIRPPRGRTAAAGRARDRSIRRTIRARRSCCSIDQPWGAFMSRQEYDLSPLHFADALVRAELGLSGIGLEINVGLYARRQRAPRRAGVRPADGSL